MFTLVYFNGKLNKPETLSPFLHSNVGKNAMLRVDCVTPYKGTEQELINDVCKHLSRMAPNIQVTYTVTCESEASSRNSGDEISYLVIPIQVNQRN